MTAQALTPILNVSNLAESFAWFEKIGWTKAWDWEGGFGCVCSGKAEIFLCVGAQGGRGKSTLATTCDAGEAADKGVWMSLWVENADAALAECQAAGHEITMPITNEPWNVREFHLRHPDGHVFRIGQAIEHAS